MSNNMFLIRTNKDHLHEIKTKELNDMVKNDKHYVIKSKIYNLSIKDIAHNLGQTFIDMINEFSIYRNDENKRLTDYVRIITHEDRLIYVGIIFSLISIRF